MTEREYEPFAPVPPGVDWRDWVAARTGAEQEELMRQGAGKVVSREQEQQEREIARQKQEAALKEAFPTPVNRLSWEENRAICRALNGGNNSLLKHHALVIYRCGYKRPNGAVRGCFLGAVLNVKGDKYWARSQVLSPGTVSSNEIIGHLDHGAKGWGEHTNAVLDGAVDHDGVWPFEARSITDAFNLDAVDGFGHGVSVSPASYWVYSGDYDLCGVNCAHSEDFITGERAIQGIEKVKNKRNKTLYLTGMLGSEL